VKVAQFNVRGSEEQAHRWQRAASADGFRSAGAWLAWAADCFLKTRARAALPVPLAWSLGSFLVVLDGVERVVRGWLSPPRVALAAVLHLPGQLSRPELPGPASLHPLLRLQDRGDSQERGASATAGLRDGAGHPPGRSQGFRPGRAPR
jgi:hypothetical protein